MSEKTGTGRRQTCGLHNHAAPVREDFIDFPTGWRIQCEGLTHTDPRCSAVQTDGAMLCDCPALEAEWHRRVAEQQSAAASEQTP